MCIRDRSGNIRIQAKEGEITVNSLKRGYGSPSYQGILELRTTAEGIAIINEDVYKRQHCKTSDVIYSYLKLLLKTFLSVKKYTNLRYN